MPSPCSVIARLQEELERVNERREREREGRRAVLFDEIQPLWEKLQAPEEEMERFLKDNPCLSEGTTTTVGGETLPLHPKP